MFPLQLLALIFISVPWNQKEEKVERRKEEKQDEEEQEEEVKVDRKDRMCAGTLKRGDLLVVPRTLFTHFGIYLGGGR